MVFLCSPPDGASFPVQIVKDGTSYKLFMQASPLQATENVNLAEFAATGGTKRFVIDEFSVPNATTMHIGTAGAGTYTSNTAPQLTIKGASAQAASIPVLQVKDSADAECFAVNPDKSVDIAGDLTVTGGPYLRLLFRLSTKASGCS